MTTTLISCRSGSNRWYSCEGGCISGMKQSPWETFDKLAERGKPANGLVDGLEFLSRLEAHGFSGRNVHLCAGARVAADTGLARAHVKDSKSAQLNALALGQRFLHAVKHRFHGQLSLGFGDAGFVDHFIDDIELNHRSALLKIIRKGVTCRDYWTSTHVVNGTVSPIRWLLCRSTKIPAKPRDLGQWQKKVTAGSAAWRKSTE